MSREWKPGDVAMVNDATQPDKPWKAATCVASRTPERETTWVLHDTGGHVWGSVSKARPLVVIDPEDYEQVEQFAVAAYPWYADNPRALAIRTDQMQAALREYADPKPDYVYAHFLKDNETTGGGIQAAVCGKVWRSDDTPSVGKCPDCVRIVDEGWKS